MCVSVDGTFASGIPTVWLEIKLFSRSFTLYYLKVTRVHFYFPFIRIVLFVSHRNVNDLYESLVTDFQIPDIEKLQSIMTFFLEWIEFQV